MAAKSKKNGAHTDGAAQAGAKERVSAAAENLQTLVRGQLEEAQKRFQGLEAEAQKVLQNVSARAQASRLEIEGLLDTVRKGEMPFDVQGVLGVAQGKAEDLAKKAGAAGAEVQKRLTGLQTRVVEAVGVASQSQVQQINRELARLGKKLDSLVGKKPAPKSEPRA